MRRLTLKTRRGFLLITALFALSGMMTLSAVGLTRSMSELAAANRSVDGSQTFQIAEGRLDLAMQQIKKKLGAGNFPDLPALMADILPVSQPGYTFPVAGNQLIYTAPATTRTIGTGMFQGMQAFTRPAEITVQAISTTTGRNVKLRVQLQLDLIPIYQFAIFDYGDLQLYPGGGMTIGGAVHSNGRIAVGPSSGALTIDGRVTAVGDFLHLTPNTDNVTIRNSNGVTYGQMKNGDGTWLESVDADWATESVTRWGSAVTAHAGAIELPGPENVDPGDLIQLCDPGDPDPLKAAKYCTQADLRIIDGNAFRQDGTLVALPGGTLTTTTFWDEREQKTMHVLDINVGQLRTSGLSPSNGILYVGSTLGVTDSVRLVNGGQLPSRTDGYGADGLTIATHNPLYVKGDYNSVNKQPAALLADALTVLSNAWTDANSAIPTLSRNATDTTVNAAIVAGQARGSTSTSSEYGVRFLEDWWGRNFRFTGSEISMWESREATKSLACCGATGAYVAPNRIWTFDSSFLTSLTSLPPGSLKFHSLVSVMWREEQP